MPSKIFVCGQPDGPVAETCIFNSRFLYSSIVNSLVVNNLSNNCIYPAPDFNHYPKQGLVVKNTGNWVAGDKVEIYYTDFTYN